MRRYFVNKIDAKTYNADFEISKVSKINLFRRLIIIDANIINSVLSAVKILFK